jgi:hypothetical protein
MEHSNSPLPNLKTLQDKHGGLGDHMELLKKIAINHGCS